MEDAMIINKSAYQRGLGHGSIYKSEFVELKEQKNFFGRDPKNEDLNEKLDTDGLPFLGATIREMDPYYW